MKRPMRYPVARENLFNLRKISDGLPRLPTPVDEAVEREFSAARDEKKE